MNNKHVTWARRCCKWQLPHVTWHCLVVGQGETWVTCFSSARKWRSSASPYFVCARQRLKRRVSDVRGGSPGLGDGASLEDKIASTSSYDMLIVNVSFLPLVVEAIADAATYGTLAHSWYYGNTLTSAVPTSTACSISLMFDEDVVEQWQVEWSISGWCGHSSFGSCSRGSILIRIFDVSIRVSYLQLGEMQLDNKADWRADVLTEDMMEEMSTKIEREFIEVHRWLQIYFQQYVWVMLCSLHYGAVH